MASFIEAVLKRKVATICDHVGYHAITRESSNILVDLYRRTITHLARHCKEAANNNRRVEPTLIDLVQAYNFVGISISELQEHAETVRIPFDIKLEDHIDTKPSNRVQRDLLIDDLLDAVKNIGQAEDKDDGSENKAVGHVDEPEKNMTPLLTDIYKEVISFPNPVQPIKADKVMIKREEKPIIPKLKITPLDPSVAEPPSFLPILTGVDENLSYPGSSHPSPPPLNDKPKRGRQKGTKLKNKAHLKTSSSSVKASNKVVAKAKGKSSKTKLKTKIKTKLKAQSKGRQAKETTQASTTSVSPEHRLTPSPQQPTYSPPPEPLEPPLTQLKIKPEPTYPEEDVPLDGLKFGQQKQAKQKKRKRSSNQFAIVTETVSAAAEEEEEWLCPNCNGPDNGDLMVGCDTCDLWYHLRCTNLKKPPKDDENWSCSRCSKVEKKTPTPTLPPQATTSVASTSKSQSKGRKRPLPELPIKSSKTPELKTLQSPTQPPKVSMHELSDAAPPNRPSAMCISQDDLCPECQLPDDGTLMIQCDDPFCARWFHGKCVSVLEEPKDDESWFCKVCVDKQQSAFKRRRRI